MQRFCKTCLPLLALLALAYVPLQAQPHHGPGPHHGPHPIMMMDFSGELREVLDLSDEQVAQITQLREDVKAQLDDVRQNAEPGEGHEAAREILDQAREQMAEILSEEQLTQLRAYLHEQRQAHREAWQSVDHQALRSELRDYRQNNIQPVMREQRAKLEAELSEEDKAAIADIRAELAQAQAQAQAEREERRARSGEGEEDDMRQYPHHRRRHPHPGGRYLAENPETKLALENLVTKYDPQITDLLDEVEPQRRQWREDQRAIMDRYAPEGFERPEPPVRGDRPDTGERDENGMLMHKIRFLLMDPNQAGEVEAFATDGSAFSATAYPNPAVNGTTLSFELTQEGPVRIELRDEKGMVVETLSRETFSLGAHRFPIDLTGLRNGTYYVTLATEDGSASVKLVVVK